jgi:hypothetical protein
MRATTQPRKPPQRRALTHLPATCQVALEILNDVAWTLLDGGAPIEDAALATLLPAVRKARQVLRDGLSVVEPKRDE